MHGSTMGKNGVLSKAGRATTAALLVILGAGCSAMDQANQRASEREITTISPSVQYDPEEAAAAMQPGSSTINGVAFAYWKRNPLHLRVFQDRVFAENSTVVVLPATAYVKDWYKTRKDKEGPRTRVAIDPRIRETGRTVPTDGYGRFQVPNLKPGEYYLACRLSWSEQKSRKVQTGTIEANDGSSAGIYQQQGYYQQHAKEVEKFVTIDQDGQVLEVELSN